MLMSWNHFASPLPAFDELRRRMDRLFEDAGLPGPRHDPFLAHQGPRMNLYDVGPSLTLTAEVPGLGEEDVQITLNKGVLTVRGSRKEDLPEGATVHRRERSAMEFARSFNLPARVDPERCRATVRNGILTVEMEKVPEAQPRSIRVRSDG